MARTASWYVPKQNGWLNVGIGGMAERMKTSGRDIKDHWSIFAGMLGRSLAVGAVCEPAGYSYYLRGRVDVVRRDNVFIAGDDAAGLATRMLDWAMTRGAGAFPRSPRD